MKINTDQVQELVMIYGIDLITAVIILIIGFKISSVLVRNIEKLFDKKGLEPSLRSFIGSLVGWTLKICVLLAAANTVGVKTTSFLAVLGSVGLAVGLALQGSLSNFAGGVIILILRPFRVGDVIDTGSFIGTVNEITVFHTILKTPDNKIVIIPNGGLANSTVTNINREPIRRVDITMGIAYEDDISQAKQVMTDVMNNDPRLLQDPALAIHVSTLGDSSVNIVAKAWVQTPDYWAFHNENLENLKVAFDKSEISIPFPQRDVHLYQTQK